MKVSESSGSSPQFVGQFVTISTIEKPLPFSWFSNGVNQVLADYGLYSSEWSIIVTLKKNGPISQIALAKYLNIEPAAISKTVVKLEEKGFVGRKYINDKREKKVSLTEKALSQYTTWKTRSTSIGNLF